jgi:hypothetical protein
MNTKADGKNGIEVVVVDRPGDLPRAFGANYPEFPDSWSGKEFPLLVNVLEVLVDGADIFLKKFRDKRLREPDGLVFETTFNASSAERFFLKFCPGPTVLETDCCK